jgi:hypothetical protein
MPHLYTLRDEAIRARALAAVRAAPLGWDVKIEPPTRTNRQNAKMRAMLTEVARAKPGGRKCSTDVWKALFMNACGYAVQFETGLNGEPFPVGFRSSHLSKAQMSDLIEFIQAWCAENGVELSQ